MTTQTVQKLVDQKARMSPSKSKNPLIKKHELVEQKYEFVKQSARTSWAKCQKEGKTRL